MDGGLESKTINCKNCGAPVTSEKCPYCGSLTGLSTAKADMDDTYLVNGRCSQTVKLLVQSPEGPRFIMYQMGRIDHPYGLNTKIDLYVYNNYFMIDKKKEKIKW